MPQSAFLSRAGFIRKRARTRRLVWTILLLALFFFSRTASGQVESPSQWLAFNRAGAPNSSLQCFMPGNITVLGGELMITTRKQSAVCSSYDLPSASHAYTSGFLAMRSFRFLYGTVVVRAKFGGGTGTGSWPVIWMLDAGCQASDPTGTDDCNGQEIDIAEILKSDFTHVNQQIHVDNLAHNDGCIAATPDTSRNFHEYRLTWSPGSLVYAIDGMTTCIITRSYIPNAPMYLKISVHVGSYGGPVDDSSLPWTTLVDYVAVTQGSTVIFRDDFKSASTIMAGPESVNKASRASGFSLNRARATWLLSGLVLLFVAGAAVPLARRGRS